MFEEKKMSETIRKSLCVQLHCVLTVLAQDVSVVKVILQQCADEMILSVSLQLLALEMHNTQLQAMIFHVFVY